MEYPKQNQFSEDKQKMRDFCYHLLKANTPVDKNGLLKLSYLAKSYLGLTVTGNIIS